MLKRFLHPKHFDPKRTEYTCATWTPPSPPDAESHRWYRAATLIHAEGWRKNTRQAQDMITLYEAAASKGHYQAINNLYLLYTNGHGASGTLYAPLPSRARKWLHYGLDKTGQWQTTGCLMRCMKEMRLPPQPETWSCLPAKSGGFGCAAGSIRISADLR